MSCEDQMPVVYFLAAYGQTDDIMTESKGTFPQNVYAFSKVQMDSLASQYARQFLMEISGSSSSMSMGRKLIKVLHRV